MALLQAERSPTFQGVRKVGLLLISAFAVIVYMTILLLLIVLLFPLSVLQKETDQEENDRYIDR